MSRTIKFLPNAPKELKILFCKTFNAYKVSHPGSLKLRPVLPGLPIWNSKRDTLYLTDNFKISKKNKILERLLTDPKMKKPWTQISTFCTDYSELWSEIFMALWKSHEKVPLRGKQRGTFQRLAQDAENLAGAIANGPLNRLFFEFFSDQDGLAVFMVENWEALGEEKRQKVAYKMLPYWHSMEELLLMLSQGAKRCAKEALTNKRIVERETHDRRLNYFVRHLARYFKEHTGKHRDATLAVIASVVFEENIDLKMVRQALRHQKLV